MVTDSKLEAKIAEIKAAHEANAEREIEQYKLSFEVEGAKKELAAKHKKENKDLFNNHTKEFRVLAAEQAKETKAFELKYCVDLPSTKDKKESLPVNTKAKMISELMVKGKPKYQFIDGKIIGLKGDEVKSVIVFKDKDKNKQTLNVSSYIDWCTDNLTSNTKHINPEIKPDLGFNLGNL